MNQVARLFVRQRNADDLFLTVLAALDAAPHSAPRGMGTRESLHAQIVLDDPIKCLLTLQERKLNYKFAVAEWLWIASGDNRTESIAPYCKEIVNYSDNGETFFGAYGPRWRPQTERAIGLLRTDPDSRQAVVSTWRPNDEWARYVESGYESEKDDPRARCASVTKDVPCTLTTQYLIRDGKLITLVTMRSWDAWFGLPYDVFNFSMLGAMVANELEVEQGPLSVSAGSLHLYDRNYEKSKDLLKWWSRQKENNERCELPRPALLSSGMLQMAESKARHGLVAAVNNEAMEFYYSVLAGKSQIVMWEGEGNEPGK